MARRVDTLMRVLSEIKNIGAAVGTEDLNGEGVRGLEGRVITDAGGENCYIFARSTL